MRVWRWSGSIQKDRVASLDRDRKTVTFGGSPELAHNTVQYNTWSPCPKTSCILLFSIVHQAELVEMWRTQIREEESRIEAEKRIKYKGTARIRLKWLHFQWNRPRELDGKNVERLKADFRKDCRRLDELNHIPAVIDQQSLDAAEALSGVSARQLGKYPRGGNPELVFPAGYQVECLHGRHRIQAAKELGLEWWTVDLYLAGRLVLSVDNNNPDRRLEQTSTLT